MIIRKSYLWVLKQVCIKTLVCISVSFVNKICRLNVKFRQNSLGLKGMKSDKAEIFWSCTRLKLPFVLRFKVIVLRAGRRSWSMFCSLCSSE